MPIETETPKSLLEKIILYKKKEIHIKLRKREYSEITDRGYLREKYEKKLKFLGPQREKVCYFLNKYQIDEADAPFISELLSVAEQHVADENLEIWPASKPDPESALENKIKICHLENVLFEKLKPLIRVEEELYVKRALIRYQKRKGEIPNERKTLAIGLSNNRKVYFDINDGKSKIRFEPKFTDYRKVRVEIGPNAADIVLKGKLTEKDYKNISDGLCSLKDEVGLACSIYFNRVQKWAYFEYEHEGKKNISERKTAALELRGVFEINPEVEPPMTDIPILAIFHTAAKAILKDTEVIQPFSLY